MFASETFHFHGICRKNEEPTSGLEPLSCSLRVIGQALQGFAQGCKSPIPKRLSLLGVAACCTVLRSRWYQSGVNITQNRMYRATCNARAAEPSKKTLRSDRWNVSLRPSFEGMMLTTWHPKSYGDFPDCAGLATLLVSKKRSQASPACTRHKKTNSTNTAP